MDEPLDTDGARDRARHRQPDLLSVVSGRLSKDQQRAGGLFLVAKGTMETHRMLQGHEQEARVGTLTFGAAVVEIILFAARARKKRRLQLTALGEIVGEWP